MRRDSGRRMTGRSNFHFAMRGPRVSECGWAFYRRIVNGAAVSGRSIHNPKRQAFHRAACRCAPDFVRCSMCFDPYRHGQTQGSRPTHAPRASSVPSVFIRPRIVIADRSWCRYMLSLKQIVGRMHRERSDIQQKRAVHALMRPPLVTTYGNRCLTPSRSSVSSLSVMSMRSFENESISRPSTILYSPFSVVTGKPNITSLGMP